MNKKGDTKLMHELIGVILTLVIFLILVSIVVKLLSTYSGDHEGKSFDGFVQKIIEVLQTDDSLYIDNNFILTLGDDNDPFIVAWDYDYQPTDLSNYLDSCFSDFYPPSSCENVDGTTMACVCLYKDNPECAEKDKDKNVIRCQTFPGEVYFMSFYKDANFELNQFNRRDKTENDAMIKNILEPYGVYDSRFAYLGFEGDIGIFAKFGLAPLYIEKTVVDDKTFVLILPVDEKSSSEIDKRELLVKTKLGNDRKIVEEKISSYANSNQLVKLYTACEEYQDKFPAETVPKDCFKAKECKVTTNICQFDHDKNEADCICSSVNELCKVSSKPFCTDAGCSDVHPNSNEKICIS
jgi:hypothetical protein